MKSLGIDLGTSFVKACVYDHQTGQTVAQITLPEHEMPINAPGPGFAEQSPEQWWQITLSCFNQLNTHHRGLLSEVKAVGIAYQMHGLVCLDQNGQVVHPAILWCDGRAYQTGRLLTETIGISRCQQSLKILPDNFTASKLFWLKLNKPALFEKIRYIMLPGDYLAYKLSGIFSTTDSGLSEGALWDWSAHAPAWFVLEAMNVNPSLIPDVYQSFGSSLPVSEAAAKLTGLPKGIPISYRCGDQPNNAFALNANAVGNIAANAGTSGVLYGIVPPEEYQFTNKKHGFKHVFGEKLGVLACVNGAGISYRWLSQLTGKDYTWLNLAAESADDSNLLFFPYGNGAERTLEGKQVLADLVRLDFNIHSAGHLAAAVLEGVLFALYYSWEDVTAPTHVSAPNANLFLSRYFSQTFANLFQTQLTIYQTDGATGAARGALLGAFSDLSYEQVFASLVPKMDYQSGPSAQISRIQEKYSQWKQHLEQRKLNAFD